MIDLIILLSDKECDLEKLLLSVVMQTMSDELNIFIMNSCSYEGIDDIVNKFSKKININVVNLFDCNSLAEIKQKAISITNSDYLMFLESNYIFFDCFAVDRLYKKIASGFFDIVSGNVVEYLGDDNFREPSSLKNSIVCKLFSRTFIVNNNICFNQSKVNEDFSFLDQCKLLSDKICFLDEKICLCCKLESIDIITFVDSYVENVFWVVENVKSRVDNFKIRIYIHDSLAFLYSQYFEDIIYVGIDKFQYYINRLETLYKNYN